MERTRLDGSWPRSCRRTRRPPRRHRGADGCAAPLQAGADAAPAGAGRGGTADARALSDHLSYLADTLLAETLRRCWDGLKNAPPRGPRFAVIGYGKLGGKELGYASDLDLVFLYDDDDERAQEIYARLAQRINTWLGTLTRPACSTKPTCACAPMAPPACW
jgi:hypothetical protein